MITEFVELIVAAVAAPFIVAAGVVAEILLLNFARSIGVDPAQLLLAEAVVIPLAIALFSRRNRGTTASGSEVAQVRDLKTTRRAA